jgi:hypothetical protein
MIIENLNTNMLNISKINKKYYNITYENEQINIKNLICHIPFGIEKFNDKILLNIELLDSNENNNILSKIDSIQNIIINKFPNLGLISCIKKSKLGYLLRTHFLKSTECYILKKNNEKIIIDECNLNLSDCEIDLTLKGIWINDNNFGLYFVINSIKVIKFN